MQSVIRFCKNHWITLASAVSALVFVMIGVLGMMSDTVATKLEERARNAAQINGLKANAKNQEVIDRERERGQQFEAEYNRTVEEAHRINRREVLIGSIFPKPANMSMPFAFKDAYQRAVRQLPREMNAGDLPDENDIREAEEQIAELKEREREAAEEGGESAKAVDPTRTTGAAASSAGTGAASGAETDPKYDAALRARVAKARSIRCYASTRPERSSFHISPIIHETQPPKVADMWFAQVGLWIQQDIVKAIDLVNDDAAKQLGGAIATVERMPIKRLEAVMIDGYVLADKVVEFQRAAGGASGGGTFGAAAPVSSLGGRDGKSFTGRVCDRNFDVIRFELSVIVDQRDLLKLPDAMSRQNFCQLVDCDYTSLDPKEKDEGYMYGTEPVVRARMVFEVYMARKIFGELMPKEVADLLSVGGA